MYDLNNIGSKSKEKPKRTHRNGLPIFGSNFRSGEPMRDLVIKKAV